MPELTSYRISIKLDPQEQSLLTRYSNLFHQCGIYQYQFLYRLESFTGSQLFFSITCFEKKLTMLRLITEVQIHD